MKNYSISNKHFYLFFEDQQTKLNVKQLAALAGIAQKTAYKWLNGSQKPLPEKIELMQIKAFGVILGVKEWRVVNGMLTNPRYKRPVSLDALPMMAMLYDNQRLHDQNRIADANRLLALEEENARLRAQMMELAAPSDNSSDLAPENWPDVAQRDRISASTPTQRPKQRLQ